MKDEERIELVLKTRDWIMDATREITMAGGFSEAIIKKIPSDVLSLLVCNNLKLKYIATKES